MKHCPIHMIRPFISVHWKVKSKKKVFLWLFTPNKSKLPCPSHYPAAQTCKFCPIASLTLSRPKIEHLISFFQILSPIFAPHIMVIHGKRTTIFSIFVFCAYWPIALMPGRQSTKIPKIPYWTWCSILTWRPDRRTRITKETVKRWQHWIPCLPILPAADIFIPLFWFHRIHITEKRTGHSAGPKKKRGSKSVLMSEISASQCRPNLYPYRRRIRGCLTETDNGRQAGPRPGGCIGIDRLSPWQSCKNARFLATSGCRHTLSIYFQPAATGAQTDKIRVCLSYPEEKEGKTPPRNRRPW